MDEDLEQRIQLMKREIDALQIAMTSASKPWYYNVSVWISVIALLFSFGTTYVSYRHTAIEDIANKRQELRGLLQRMAALPKENVEVLKKYSDDPVSGQTVSSYINQENTLLAKNAAELAKKLPATYVSSTEYYAIAVALANAYDLAGTDEFLDYSIKAATDFNTEIGSLRMKASMQFIEGHPEDGRVEFQKALNIFAKYPQYNEFTKAMTNGLTELQWAVAEGNIDSVSLANQHIENAEKIVASLPTSPGANTLRGQISQMKSQISSGKPIANPVGGPQLSLPPKAEQTVPK